jgi:hypothetical protein
MGLQKAGTIIILTERERNQNIMGQGTVYIDRDGYKVK